MPSAVPAPAPAPAATSALSPKPGPGLAQRPQRVQRPRALSPSDESVVSSGMTTELDSASTSSASASASTSASADEPEPAKAATGDGDDFLWMYTEEPHRSRRMAILKTHPEVSPDHRLSLLPLHGARPDPR